MGGQPGGDLGPAGQQLGEREAAFHLAVLRPVPVQGTQQGGGLRGPRLFEVQKTQDHQRVAFMGRESGTGGRRDHPLSKA